MSLLDEIKDEAVKKRFEKYLKKNNNKLNTEAYWICWRCGYKQAYVLSAVRCQGCGRLESI